jgi:Putative prokaryotic signal transducing protein
MLFSFEGDPEPTPPEGLVTVGRFDDPVEAQMARGMLEAAGVEVFMVGENVNNIMPGAFRVRIQVRVEDEVAARELLSSGDTEDEDEL